MDELTKFLVNELIDGKSVTAIYGGGFKPPTKGHFDLVKTALKDFKDIDKFIIYVGGGVRDGIEQEQSMQVWDIYKELLPSKVQIEPSPSPIGDVLRYAKNHPDEKVYFLLGYREGREDDLNDIKSRTKGVEEKYPNLEVRVIKSPEGDMSGTNARKALQKGDKEKFFTFLPDEIPANEKEDIYNILEPNILKEGDPKTGTGKKPKGSSRRLYTDEDPSDTVKVKFSSKQDIIDTFSKSSFKSKPHARKSQIINLIHQRVRAAYERAKDPEVKRRLKTALDYAEQKKEASKEKTERLKKENVAPNHDDKSAPFGSGYKPLKENTIPSINILEKIAELTNYMRDKGYNIDPVPSIVLVDDDVNNAEEFLGKTAYYDPINKSITLYTYGRHPKDIVRSYSHEMIHHIQNLEGRLGDITTTNTQEDDHLNDIEAEANLKGTMTFRNWTDSLQEDGQETSNKNMDDYKKQNNPSGKVKDPFGLNQYARELAMGLQEVGEATSKQYEWEIINSNPGDYEFSFTTDSGIEYDVQLVQLNYEDEETGEFINGLEIGFGAGEEGRDKSDKAVINRGEVFRVMATIVNIIQYATKLIPDFKNTNALIYNPAPKKGEDVLGNQRDKLYQAFIKKVYPKAKFEREGSALVAKLAPLEEISYLHNTGVNENDEEMRGKKYVIFCDMDGVLVDFDKGYKELTGVSTQHADSQGKNEFWDLYRNSLKEKNIPEKSYWANLDWMPDGKQLWDYISPYNPYVLTAPSVNFDIPFEERYKLENNESMQGKTEWVQRLPNMRKLYFRAAKRKADFAGPNKILIDDRKDTIDSWNANGGIGIFHTTAANTIKQLQDLGL